MDLALLKKVYNEVLDEIDPKNKGVPINILLELVQKRLPEATIEDLEKFIQ